MERTPCSYKQELRAYHIDVRISTDSPDNRGGYYAQILICHQFVPFAISLDGTDEFDVSRIVTLDAMMLVEVGKDLVAAKVVDSRRDVSNQTFLE